jgi:arsenate reductase
MNNFLSTISAINDETRVKLLRFIDKCGETCVCDIESSFNMIQSRISRHLKILKDAGYLRVDRRGRWAYYSVRSPLDKFRMEILKEISYLDIEIPTLLCKCNVEKKVLILCTGNSCRSIIAEALINKNIEGVKAYSSGVKSSLHVNPNAIKILKEEGAWDESYHSKVLDDIMNIEFDLIITVCDNAKENCPIFDSSVEVLHVGFEDPDGKEFEEFRKTMKQIKDELLPIVKERLNVVK